MAAIPGRPAWSCRPSTGPPSGPASSVLAGGRPWARSSRPGPPEGRAGLPALSLDYAPVADLARLAPTGPGNPDPLIVVAGLTVTRVRAAAGGHTQLTLKRRLDVIDGIAFGWTELAEPRPRRRPARRRRPADHPLVRRLRVAPARDPGRGPVRFQRSHRCPIGGAGPLGAIVEPARDPRASAVRRQESSDGRQRAPPGPRRGPPIPYGLMPRTGLVAPTDRRRSPARRSALVTAALFDRLDPDLGRLQVHRERGGGGGGGGGQSRSTPRPPRRTSSWPIPRANIPGSLVYVKAGNVWIQTPARPPS